MRRHVVLASIVLFHCSSLTPLTEKRSGEVATDPDVLPILWQMLGDAGLGFRHTEEAAFIVRKGDGRLIVVRWPEAGEPDTSRWAGPLPDGVVAIVHTHPNWEPLPSKIDDRTAGRIRLPVYVVTRTEISKTVGGSPEIVLSGDWGCLARRASASFEPGPRNDATGER